MQLWVLYVVMRIYSQRPANQYGNYQVPWRGKHAPSDLLKRVYYLHIIYLAFLFLKNKAPM